MRAKVQERLMPRKQVEDHRPGESKASQPLYRASYFTRVRVRFHVEHAYRQNIPQTVNTLMKKRTSVSQIIPRNYLQSNALNSSEQYLNTLHPARQSRRHPVGVCPRFHSVEKQSVLARAAGGEIRAKESIANKSEREGKNLLM